MVLCSVEAIVSFYAKPFHLSYSSLFRMNSDGIACSSNVHSTESKIDRLIYCIKNECIGIVGTIGRCMYIK